MRTSERRQVEHETGDPIVAHESAKRHALELLKHQVDAVQKMGTPGDTRRLDIDPELIPVVLDLKGAKGLLEKPDPSDAELRPILERRLQGARKDLAAQEAVLVANKKKRLKFALGGVSTRLPLDEEIADGERSVNALRTAVGTLEAETMALSRSPEEEAAAESSAEEALDSAAIIAAARIDLLKKAIPKLAKDYDARNELGQYIGWQKDIEGTDKAAAKRAAKEVLTRAIFKLNHRTDGKPQGDDEADMDNLLEQLGKLG